MQNNKRNLHLSLLLVIAGLAFGPTAWAANDSVNEWTVETTRVLSKKGAPIHGANGLNFGPNGMLYVASVVGREIVVMDPKSGRILDRIGPERGVETPDDLVFGPDGSLYWTAFTTGEVGKLPANGDPKCTVAYLPGAPNAITFSNDGRLFVTINFIGDALFEVDPNNCVDPSQQAPQTPTTIAPGPLGFLNAMDFGPDGRLYSPLVASGLFLPSAVVVSIDVDNPADDDLDFVIGRTEASGFDLPVAAKFDSQGNLYVLDNDNGNVVRVDINIPPGQPGNSEVITTLEPGLDNLAFNANDRLFVSHEPSGAIIEVQPNGVSRPVSPGGMVAPGGVAVLASPDQQHESVFVADVYTLREFNGQTGQEISAELGSILPGTIIAFPFTVAADGSNLILASFFNNTVQEVSSDGTLLQSHPFNVPLNAIRFQGDLVVSTLNNTTQTFEVVRKPAVGPVVTLAGFSLGEPIFVPAGLAANNGDLWVSDWATGVVWQIVANGLPTLVPVAFGLNQPEGLAMGPDGNLLVVETGTGKLKHINLTTGLVTTIAEGLEIDPSAAQGVPPIGIFSGVAVGPSGAIYVTGNKANDLYRITLH